MVRCNAVKSNTNANNKNEQVLSQMCSNIKKRHIQYYNSHKNPGNYCDSVEETMKHKRNQIR